MSTATRTKNGTALRVLGHAGMFCYGIVHLLVGYLALRVAFGDRSEQADQRGALAEAGSNAAGGVILWLLAVGLFAFGAWQLLLAATSFGWVQKKGKRTRKRVTAAAKAVIGVSLGITAVGLATGDSSGGSGNQQQRSWTAEVLSLPAGRILVGAGALAIIGVAVAMARRGVKKSFLDDLNTGELPAGSQRWVTRLGVAGYLAKGLVLGIVGVLIGIAGLHRDAREAGGLDAALKTVAGQPFGTAALVIVALGLAAYGVYCFAAARAHRT